MTNGAEPHPGLTQFLSGYRGQRASQYYDVAVHPKRSSSVLFLGDWSEERSCMNQCKSRPQYYNKGLLDSILSIDVRRSKETENQVG